MNTTLITTVYNEEDSISDLWNSVKLQAEHPDEWIIVDGGSNDHTVDLLRNLDNQKSFDTDVKIIEEDGANISEGRNIAVEHSSNDYIIGTDGGVELNREFVKAFKEKFEEGHKALGGVFKYKAESSMEEVQGIIRTLHHSPEEVEEGENHAPSHRSVGYHKDVWKEIGGYREDLYTGEDSRFNSDVQAAGYNWYAVPDAAAYWKMRPTYSDYWKQFSLYGQGDCRAGTMFDYHGGLYGMSKVFLMTGATWIGISGLVTAPLTIYSLSLSAIGFGLPYGYYLPHLKESVEETGLKAVPLWSILVAIQVFGHFTGYYKEWIRLKTGLTL